MTKGDVPFLSTFVTNGKTGLQEKSIMMFVIEKKLGVKGIVYTVGNEEYTIKSNYTFGMLCKKFKVIDNNQTISYSCKQTNKLLKCILAPLGLIVPIYPLRSYPVYRIFQNDTEIGKSLAGFCKNKKNILIGEEEYKPCFHSGNKFSLKKNDKLILNAQRSNLSVMGGYTYTVECYEMDKQMIALLVALLDEIYYGTRFNFVLWERNWIIGEDK